VREYEPTLAARASAVAADYLWYLNYTTSNTMVSWLADGSRAAQDPCAQRVRATVDVP
jgi:hypothetical protein